MRDLAWRQRVSSCGFLPGITWNNCSSFLGWEERNTQPAAPSHPPCQAAVFTDCKDCIFSFKKLQEHFSCSASQLPECDVPLWPRHPVYPDAARPLSQPRVARGGCSPSPQRRLPPASPPLTAAPGVSAFWGQREGYKVFPPFQGGMPKQSWNWKCITLFTFPNQEGNTAVGLLESVYGAKPCHWKKKRMGIAPV